MSGYCYRVPENYNPLAVDYHYRLEYDLVEEHEFTERHQVRIFDQGGEEGWTKFMDHKALIEGAKDSGMVENIRTSHREVKLSDDWDAGWPMLPPTLGEAGWPV